MFGFIEKQFHNIPVTYLHSSVADCLSDISEVLVEWYSLQKNSVSDFLHCENLDKYITSQQFEQLALRKLYLPNHLIVLIHKKQPFHLSLERLYALNSIVKNNYASTLLRADNSLIYDELKAIYTTQKANKQKRKSLRRLENLEEEKKKERIYGATYRNRHRQEIRERGRKKYAQNIEESRANSRIKSKKYRDAHREQVLAKNKERYYQNIDKNREQARIRSKENHKKKRFITKTGPIIFSLLEALQRKKEASL